MLPFRYTNEYLTRIIELRVLLLGFFHNSNLEILFSGGMDNLADTSDPHGYVILRRKIKDVLFSLISISFQMVLVQFFQRR